jgi:hypothetical protein
MPATMTFVALSVLVIAATFLMIPVDASRPKYRKTSEFNHQKRSTAVKQDPKPTWISNGHVADIDAFDNIFWDYIPPRGRLPPTRTDGTSSRFRAAGPGADQVQMKPMSAVQSKSLNKAPKLASRVVQKKKGVKSLVTEFRAVRRSRTSR